MKKLTALTLITLLTTACGATMPVRHSALQEAAGITQRYAANERSVSYDDDAGEYTLVVEAK